jgi:hypothetical protein
MNLRTFIQILQEDEQFRERMRRTALNEMQAAARREEITVDDVPPEAMEQLAESFVERGVHEKP